MRFEIPLFLACLLFLSFLITPCFSFSTKQSEKLLQRGTTELEYTNNEEETTKAKQAKASEIESDRYHPRRAAADTAATAANSGNSINNSINNKNNHQQKQELFGDETNHEEEVKKFDIIKTPNEFKRELSGEKREKENKRKEASFVWFQSTHPSTQQQNLDDFEKRQLEKEKFEDKLRNEREKEEMYLKKKIKWFDDPVSDDDDDLWIEDRNWQYNKKDPLMDFEDYEHDDDEVEKKIDYGELLLKRIQTKVRKMKNLEDLVTYQKDLISNYALENEEKTIEKQKREEDKENEAVALTVDYEKEPDSLKVAAFAFDKALFEEALQHVAKEEEGKTITTNEQIAAEYDKELFERALSFIGEKRQSLQQNTTLKVL